MDGTGLAGCSCFRGGSWAQADNPIAHNNTGRHFITLTHRLLSVQAVRVNDIGPAGQVCLLMAVTKRESGANKKATRGRLFLLTTFSLVLEHGRDGLFVADAPDGFGQHIGQAELLNLVQSADLR
ncbi:hypothetical protein GCM10027098_18410 [Bowmanella dokdonensis]